MIFEEQAERVRASMTTGASAAAPGAGERAGQDSTLGAWLGTKWPQASDGEISGFTERASSCGDIWRNVPPQYSPLAGVVCTLTLDWKGDWRQIYANNGQNVRAPFVVSD